MKYYMAPMEGVTTYIFRRAYQNHYEPMDKYFIPFFVPHLQKKFTTKEKNELDLEHNRGMTVIPQILTSNAEDFIRLARNIQELGYEEINLNLGCPSKTVVSKGRGAGFLDEPDKLDRFLEKIYAELTDMKISIKTRIGKDDSDEWEDLLAIYEKYPLEELIIHPRLQIDYYKNIPQWDKMRYALENSKHSLCYNGDIFTIEGYKKWRKQFVDVDCIMLGRGLIANPILREKIENEVEKEKALYEINPSRVLEQLEKLNVTMDEKNEDKCLDLERFQKFHNEVYEAYKEILSGDRNILFRMKELWAYFSLSFPDERKLWKKIQKCERCVLYESIVGEFFSRSIEKIK